jgi:FHA domain/FhaA, N-terminal domain
MSAFTRLEGLLKDAVERPVWMLSANRIHPLAIAEALAAEMDQNVLVRDGSRRAPDVFEVHLNPADRQHLGRARAQLESELATYLFEYAAEKSFDYARPPDVRLVASDEIKPGEVAAYSRFDEVLRDSGVTNVASQTKAFSVAEVQRLAYGAARLTVVGGSAKGKSFELKRSPFTIGRSPDNDAQIEDLRLSRRHAELTFDGQGGFAVRDLGSTNGTFVNDVQVHDSQRVQPRDRISLGGVELRLSGR